MIADEEDESSYEVPDLAAVQRNKEERRKAEAAALEVLQSILCYVRSEIRRRYDPLWFL